MNTSSSIFRERIQETPESESIEKPAEVTGIVEDKTDLEVFTETGDDLESWETTNGKYGLKYLGVSEIATRFPMSMQFSQIDKFIKAELETRGYDKTTKAWQEVLNEIESEIGSSKLNAIDRLRRLSEYIKAVNKLYKAKALKEKYMVA